MTREEATRTKWTVKEGCVTRRGQENVKVAVADLAGVGDDTQPPTGNNISIAHNSRESNLTQVIFL